MRKKKFFIEFHGKTRNFIDFRVNLQKEIAGKITCYFFYGGGGLLSI